MMAIVFGMIVAMLCSCTCFGRPITPTVRGGQCGQANLPCLPGMDALGAGFNIVTGTSTGMQQVIAFTYDTQSIYTNPFSNGTLQYVFPDNVTVRDSTKSSEQITSNTFYSSQELAHSLAASV
eukprot:m.422953 g.422953  ORF g.422953 m.422953 type:complete len:123 (+) comp39334_c0_seq1:104-472(+)